MEEDVKPPAEDEHEESTGPKQEPVKLGWVLGVQVSGSVLCFMQHEVVLQSSV